MNYSLLRTTSRHNDERNFDTYIDTYNSNNSNNEIKRSSQDKNKMKTQIVSGMFWKFAERIIAQGVSFIVTVVLARLLMPDDYGAVAIVSVFINIATVFLTSGLNVSLIQKKNANDTDFSTIFWCNLSIGMFLYLVLFFAAPFIASAYKQPILCPVIRFLSICLPISSFQSIQAAYISKTMQFRKFFFSTIIGTLISAIVGIAMAYKGFGIWALVTQHITNTVIDTIVLFITIRWRPRFVFSKASAIPLTKFGYKITLTDLIATILNNLVSFLIGIKYTSSDLAYYTKGLQVPRLFRDNIFTTVISVLFPAMSNISDNVEYVKKLTRRAIKLMCYLIFPMMFGMLTINKTFIVALFTEKWIAMSPYVIISCLEAVMSVSPTIGFQAVKSLGRSDILLKNEVLTKPVYIIFIVIGMFISPMAMAIGMLLTSIYSNIIAMVLIRSTVKYSLREQLADVIKPFTASCVMLVVVWCVGIIDINHVFKLIVQILVGAVVYLRISLTIKDESYNILRGLFLSKISMIFSSRRRAREL